MGPQAEGSQATYPQHNETAMQTQKDIFKDAKMKDILSKMVQQ